VGRFVLVDFVGQDWDLGIIWVSLTATLNGKVLTQVSLMNSLRRTLGWPAGIVIVIWDHHGAAYRHVRACFGAMYVRVRLV